MSIFNPNELVLDRIRAVEEYDPATSELVGRYTQIEDPNLKTSADANEVKDAFGAPIMELYRAQKGSFGFSNSLFSLDLAASQFGSKKEVASDLSKIIMPVSETITISSDHKVILKYTPVGVAGAEVKYVKVINDNNTFGKTYEIAAVSGEGKFTLDKATKTITLPADATGKVFVKYDKETATAVKVSKTTDSEPKVTSLLIHAIFRDPCNKNLVYAGVISAPRAQIDPTSVDIALKADGKHPVTYKLQKPLCSETGNLFDIIVSQD